MSDTLGFHLIKTTYGTWLPGDPCGSWSEAWSPQRGYFEPHRFHEPDERRFEMARERIKYQPVELTPKMTEVIIQAIINCVRRSEGGLRIMAAAIEPTHMHLLLPNTGRDIDITAKWLADQTTKAVHRHSCHLGPLWTKNNWCDHIDSEEHWENAILYIDDHNMRSGRGSRPYPFLEPINL